MAAAPVLLPQNYHRDCEAGVNILTDLQLYVSYCYLAMAAYFRRSDVALKHFSRFFLRRSRQCRELAEKLMSMQTERGGRVVFNDISKPEKDEWLGGLQAMENAFHLEKTINESFLELHELAASKNDVSLCYFLRCHCLRPQAEVVKELGEHVTTLRKMGTLDSGLAGYIFETLTLGKGSKTD